MKKLFLLLLITQQLYSFAQSTVTIATDKTVSLVFPNPIQHVDRGTADILVLQPALANNIIFVKAGNVDMQPTNLSVVTSDGEVHSFRIQYTPQPLHWIYKIPASKKGTIQTYANSILDNRSTLRGPKVNKNQIVARITGIYIKNEIIFCQLRIDNYSSIEYDIDWLKWYVTDQKKSKRTAIQEIELEPKWISGNIQTIKAYDHTVIVTALDKLTIPDAKYLALQLMEKNGGRHLRLRLYNKHLLCASILPDIK